jgi:hypothetical protein
MGKHVHIMSDVDPEALTGVCANCGPVFVYYIKHLNRYQCRVKRNEDKKSYDVTRVRAGFTEQNRARKYGLTSEEFDKMMTKQDNSCAICFKQFDLKVRPCVDHCHATGKVRGLLCRSCNLGIGHLGDDPARVLKAHQYLTSKKPRPPK